MVTRRWMLGACAAAVVSAGCSSGSVPDVTVTNATEEPRDVVVTVDGVTEKTRRATVTPDEPVTYPKILPDNAMATLVVESGDVRGTYGTNNVGASHGIYVTLHEDDVNFKLSVL